MCLSDCYCCGLVDLLPQFKSKIGNIAGKSGYACCVDVNLWEVVFFPSDSQYCGNRAERRKTVWTCFRASNINLPLQLRSIASLNLVIVRIYEVEDIATKCFSQRGNSSSTMRFEHVNLPLWSLKTKQLFNPLHHIVYVSVCELSACG